MAQAATCTSAADGNWSNRATWTGTGCGTAGAHYPGEGGVTTDNVIIASTHAVTLDVDNLTVASINFDVTTTASGISHNSGMDITVTGTVSWDGQGTGTGDNAIWAINDAIATVGGLISMAQTETVATRFSSIDITSGTLNANAGITFSGTDTDTKRLRITGSGRVNLKGALTATGCMWTMAAGSTLNWADTAAGQTITFCTDVGSNLMNLEINNTHASGATTGAALTVGGNLGVGSGGKFNVAGFDLTVTGTTSATGTLAHTSTTGAKAFTGAVTINSGGSWTNTANEDISFAGGFANNSGGTLTMGTGTHTFITNNQNLNGNSSITFGGAVTITGAITVTNINTGTVTITGALDGSVSGSTWKQGNASYVVLGNNGSVFATAGTLDASTNTNNTVEYSGGSSTVVKNVTYGNLKISGTISTGTQTATVGGAFTVTGTFTPSAGTITMNNGSSISNSGTLCFAGLTLASSAVVSTSASFSFHDALTVNSSAVFAPSGGTITASSSNVSIVNSGTLTFAGLTVASGAVLSTSANFAFNNVLTVTGVLAPSGGTITASSSSASIVNSGTLTFNNLTINGSGSVTTSSSFAFNGALTVNSGSTLAPSGGTITASSSSASIVNSGTLTFNNLTFNGNGTYTSSASFSFNGALTVNSGSTLAPSGGTITASSSNASIVNSGTLTFNNLTLAASAKINTSSSFAFNGALTVASGTTLAPTAGTITASSSSASISNSGTLTFNNLSFNGNGTNTSSASFAFNGALTVASGSAFTPSGGTVTASSTGASISNSGTLTFKTLAVGNSATLSANISFTVDTALTIGTSAVYSPSSGTLTINGDFTNNGTFTASGTHTVAFGSGTHTINGSASSTFQNITDTSAGSTLQFKAGQIATIAGNLTITGTGGSHIALKSDTASSAWLVHFNSAQAASNFAYVDLSDSGCDAGTSNADMSAATNTNVTPVTNGSCWQFAAATPGRYWVGGGSSTSWDATGPTNWASSSGGANNASVPTVSDDVFFDSATSAPATLSADITVRGVDFTGYAGTLTHNAGITLSIGSSTPANGNIALKMVAGMTYTLGNSTSSQISFVSTTSTLQTIVTGGKSVGNITFDGTGGNWALTDNITTASSTATVITFTNGTLHTDGAADNSGLSHSWGKFSSDNTNSRTLTLGNSSITLGLAGQSWTANSIGLTVTANTATLNFTGANAYIRSNSGNQSINWNGMSVVFTGGGSVKTNVSSTFKNFTITGTAVKTDVFNIGDSGGAGGSTTTITGILSLNGNSATNRLLVYTNNPGIIRGIILSGASASFTGSNVDFQEINVTSTGGAPATPIDLSAITGGSGDAGGNSGITFTTSATQYWYTTTTGTKTWSTVGNWFLGSGGTGGAGRVPLPQDDARFDSGSIGAGSTTVQMDVPRLGRSLDFTDVTNSPSVTRTVSSVGPTVMGSVTLVSGMSWADSSGSNTWVFGGRADGMPAGGWTITSAGNTWTLGKFLNAPGGTYKLLDDFIITSASTFTISAGTLDANNKNFQTGFFAMASSANAIVNMGSGTWTITGTTNAWNMGGAAVVNASSSIIKFTDTSASAKSFNGSGKTYYNVWFTGSGTGSYNVSGSNTFNDFKDDNTSSHSIIFTAGTTQTLATFTVSGTASSTTTLTSTNTSVFNLIKTGGGTISRDYLSISHSSTSPASTWYAGTHSYDDPTAIANSGWIFTDAPATGFVISGNIFGTDEVSTSTIAVTLKLAMDGNTSYSTSTVASDGSFYFSGVTATSTGAIYTMWVSGTTTKASLVFTYSSTNCNGSGGADCTNLKLYSSRVTLQSFDGTSITNAKLADCDNDSGSACGQTPDTDIGFTSNVGALSLTYSTNVLKIPSGTTFAPGGNVTAQKFNNAGTYTAGSETLKLTGFGVTTSRPLINTGTFTQGSGTVEYNAGNTTDLASVTSDNVTYNNLNLNNSSTVVYFYPGTGSSQTFTVNGSLTLGNGTQSNTFSVLNHNPVLNIATTTITNATTFIGGTATTTITGDLTLNSGSTWTKGTGKIVFKKGSTQTVTDNNTTKQDLGNVQVSVNGANNTTLSLGTSTKVTSLIIDTSQIFDVNGSNTLTLTGSGIGASRPLQNSGTFTQSTGTVEYNSGTTTDLASVTSDNVTYNNLTLNNSSSGVLWRTGTATSQTFIVNGSLTIGSGTQTATLGENVFDPVLNIATITVNNLATFAQGSATTTITGDLTLNSGSTWTKDTGAVVFKKGSTQILTDNTASLQDLGVVVVATGTDATILNLATSTKMTSLTIDSGQTFNVNGSYTLTLTGSGTGASRPLIINGTFTASSGTVAYTGTSTTDISAVGDRVTYNNLTLAPSAAGSPTFNLATTTNATITVVSNLVIGDGTNAVTVNANTYKPYVSLRGNLTLNNNTTFTAANNGASIFNFEGGTTQTVTDNNTTKQDLGVTTVWASTTNTTLLAGSDITMQKMTLKSNQTLDLNGNNKLTFTGNGTSVFLMNTNAVFNPSSGTIDYQGTTATNIAPTTYYNLTIDPATTVTYKLATTTVLNNLVIGNGTNALTVEATSTNPSLTFASTTIASSASLVLGSATTTLTGNLTLNSGSTFTKGTGNLVFNKGGTQTITDNNGTKQDLGSVLVQAPASPTQIEVKSGVSNSANPGVETVTFTTPTTAGELIICLVHTGLIGNAIASLVDNKNQTYTQVYSGLNLGGNHYNVSMYYKENSLDGVTTFTMTNGTNDTKGGLTCGHYTGMATSGALDQNSGTPADRGSTTWTSPSITTTQANELLIGHDGCKLSVYAGVYTCASLLADSPWITDSLQTNSALDGANGGSLIYAHRFVSAIGSYSFSGTAQATSTYNNFANIASFKALTNTTLNLGSSIKTTSLTVDPGQTLNLNGSNTLILTGSGTGSSKPFVNQGTFTAGSGTVEYTGTSATDIAAEVVYNNLTLDPGATVTYNLNGYSYKRSLTIDYTKVSNTNQSNFPVLVSVSTSTLRTIANGGNVANDNGYDIIFTSDSAGANLLSWEIESYASTTGALLAWVKIPVLSHTVNTTIYMFYGNPAISSFQSTASSVWDSNYKGVWHLSESGTGAAGDFRDSTGNANSTNTANQPTQISAKISNGQSFNGATSYINTANKNIGVNALTVSMWIKPTTNASGTILEQDAGGASVRFIIDYSSGAVRFYDDAAGGGSTSNLIATSTWSYVAMTYNGSGTNKLGYINNNTAENLGSTTADISTNNKPFIIGALDTFGTNTVNGVLDEVRVSNIARSADWIATEYNNQNSTTTFYTLGAETSTAGLTINGNLSIGDASNAVTANASTTNATLTIGGNLSIASNAIFSAPSTSTFTINGNFTNNGTFTHNSGTVTFSGSGTSALSGNSTTFNNLTVTTAGKTLQFQKHTANVPLFTIDGTFTATGVSGNPVNLISDVAGSQWLATFANQPSLNYVTVRDGQCVAGIARILNNGTIYNLGNNGACWFFIQVGGGGSSQSIDRGDGSSGGGGTPTGGGTGQGGSGSGPPPTGDGSSGGGGTPTGGGSDQGGGGGGTTP